MQENDISILGAGLIGSLLSIYLKKRGLDVSVYEKRTDPRSVGTFSEGRSINMALSNRGWKAIEKAGLKEKAEAITIPMYGRSIHDEHGSITFQPYGKENQAIYSISRSNFNSLLMDQAEKEGVHFYFGHQCVDIDIQKSVMFFEQPEKKAIKSNVIIGSDGAYSTLRSAFQKQSRFNFKQEYLSHGYKELTIPPNSSGDFAMDPNALHIWPRGKFMLIALPNLDKSFTCTLFLPFEGYKLAFDKINDDEDVKGIFGTYFQDAFHLMPNIAEEFRKNPTSALINVECFPWSQNNNLLIGDSAHAMVPFYGQGMNSGFEDCFVLDNLIEKYGTFSWGLVFAKFQKHRKPDTDAVCQLAMDNFIEMRDSVANPKFIIRKKIESKLFELFPNDWIPLYTMVTFSDMKYSEAYAQGQLQDKIMDKLMQDPLITQNWDKLDYQSIVHEIETIKSV